MAPVDLGHYNPPATWSFPRVLPSKGTDLEASFKVVERTLCPEAQEYFKRIIAVARSEMEKVMTHKVQQLIDPVLKSITEESRGEAAGKAKLSYGDGWLNAAASARSFSNPQRVKVKSASEGQQLAAYMASLLGRVMADFGRFADLVLRWKVEHEGAGADQNPLGDSAQETPGDAKDALPQNSVLDDLIERLERQDKRNSELEAKYTAICSELKEKKRDFLREKFVWWEKFRKVKAYLHDTGDRTLYELLSHEVEFYVDDEGRPQPVIEDNSAMYERKMAKMKDDYEDKIKNLEDMMEAARHEIERLNSATLAARRRNQKGEETADKLLHAAEACEILEKEKADLEAALTKALAELEELKESSSQMTLQVARLRASGEEAEELRAEKAQEQAELLQLRSEVESLRWKLEEATRALEETRRGGNQAKASQVSSVTVPSSAPSSSPASAPQRKKKIVKVLKELSVCIMPDGSWEEAQEELRKAKEQVQSEKAPEPAELQDAATQTDPVKPTETSKEGQRTKAAPSEKKPAASSASASAPPKVTTRHQAVMTEPMPELEARSRSPENARGGDPSLPLPVFKKQSAMGGGFHQGLDKQIRSGRGSKSPSARSQSPRSRSREPQTVSLFVGSPPRPPSGRYLILEDLPEQRFGLPPSTQPARQSTVLQSSLAALLSSQPRRPQSGNQRASSKASSRGQARKSQSPTPSKSRSRPPSKSRSPSPSPPKTAEEDNFWVAVPQRRSGHPLGVILGRHIAGPAATLAETWPRVSRMASDEQVDGNTTLEEVDGPKTVTDLNMSSRVIQRPGTGRGGLALPSSDGQRAVFGGGYVVNTGLRPESAADRESKDKDILTTSQGRAAPEEGATEDGKRESQLRRTSSMPTFATPLGSEMKAMSRGPQGRLGSQARPARPSTASGSGASAAGLFRGPRPQSAVLQLEMPRHLPDFPWARGRRGLPGSTGR